MPTFFVNLGNAKAHDVYSLIALAQSKVREKFGVNLELEIEFGWRMGRTMLKGLNGMKGMNDSPPSPFHPLHD